IAFRPGNSRFNHHLCLWHSLRAIDQYVTGKVRGRGLDLADTVRSSVRKTALPSVKRANQEVHCRSGASHSVHD
ncbi:hypothetical protein V1525DRAFT_408372, partial [Lipomyces kononenkoae]